MSAPVGHGAYVFECDRDDPGDTDACGKASAASANDLDPELGKGCPGGCVTIHHGCRMHKHEEVVWCGVVGASTAYEDVLVVHLRAMACNGCSGL